MNIADVVVVAIVAAHRHRQHRAQQYVLCVYMCLVSSVYVRDNSLFAAHILLIVFIYYAFGNYEM